jgi:hypothetical protein
MNWPDASMHEARITVRVIFGICVGHRGPWGAQRGQSSVTIRTAVWQPTYLSIPSCICLPVTLPSRMLIVLTSVFSETNFFRSVYKPNVIKWSCVPDIVKKCRHTFNIVINSNSSGHRSFSVFVVSIIPPLFRIYWRVTRGMGEGPVSDRSSTGT